MAHSDTTGERAPRAEELARIGTIKAELRRSAWWVAILAIVFPAAFVALAVALFIAYPSQLPVNFLTVLLGLVPVGISVLLILRGDSGRPLRLYRVLAKDAARGYLVAKRGGNIAWAAR